MGKDMNHIGWLCLNRYDNALLKFLKESIICVCVRERGRDREIERGIERYIGRHMDHRYMTDR